MLWAIVNAVTIRRRDFIDPPRRTSTEQEEDVIKADEYVFDAEQEERPPHAHNRCSRPGTNRAVR